jgi:NADH dehydrogenase [ubiquinone] 1 alpha subcomplex assembly factor 3
MFLRSSIRRVATARRLSARLYSDIAPNLDDRSKILRPKQKDASERKPMEEPRASKGTLEDHDIYDDLAPPLNNIEGVLENGFKLASGRQVLSKDENSPRGLVLVGSEAFEVNLQDGLKGLDKGMVEIEKDVLGIFNLVHPKPEMLVVGLGAKSRILGHNTSKYLHSLGFQLQVSNTPNGCANFDLLATERPGQVAAFLFPPNL